MLEINLCYFTDLQSHRTTIIINNEMICEDDERQKINFITQTSDDIIIVKLYNHLPNIPPATTKNPLKIIAAVFIMFVSIGVFGGSYDFECWDYETTFTFIPSHNHVSIELFVKGDSESHRKANIFAKTKTCVKTNVDKNVVVNEKYTKEQFDEYHYFNCGRTVIMALIFVIIAVVGIINHNVVTLIWTGILFIGNVILFFVSRHLLLKTEKGT